MRLQKIVHSDGIRPKKKWPVFVPYCLFLFHLPKGKWQKTFVKKLIRTYSSYPNDKTLKGVVQCPYWLDTLNSKYIEKKTYAKCIIIYLPKFCQALKNIPYLFVSILILLDVFTNCAKMVSKQRVC